MSSAEDLFNISMVMIFASAFCSFGILMCLAVMSHRYGIFKNFVDKVARQPVITHCDQCRDNRIRASLLVRGYRGAIE